MSIRHPISSKIIGAVNLTCWRKDAGQLLIALAKSTAGQVAASQAEIIAAAPGRAFTPACASLPVKGNSVMPEQAATRRRACQHSAAPCTYPDGSALRPPSQPASAAPAGLNQGPGRARDAVRAG